eukprot:2077152-Prymnesium_polylepis.2
MRLHTLDSYGARATATGEDRMGAWRVHVSFWMIDISRPVESSYNACVNAVARDRPDSHRRRFRHLATAGGA